MVVDDRAPNAPLTRAVNDVARRGRAAQSGCGRIKEKAPFGRGGARRGRAALSLAGRMSADASGRRPPSYRGSGFTKRGRPGGPPDAGRAVPDACRRAFPLHSARSGARAACYERRPLIARCAASSPSASSISTASAAAPTMRSGVLVRLEVGEHEVGERPRDRRAPGRPTPTRRRRKSGVPSCSAIERSPLWPARPPPSRACSRPSVEVALVVDDEQRVRLELEERDRGLHGAAGVVHVRLGLQQRDLVAVDADLREPAVELRAPGAVVAARELVDDQPADVVPVARVLAAGIAEARDEQVERGAVPARPEAHRELSPSAVPGSPLAPLAARPRPRRQRFGLRPPRPPRPRRPRPPRAPAPLRASAA